MARKLLSLPVMALLMAGFAIAVACGEDGVATKVQTVIVEKQVAGETVFQTVVVQKVVEKVVEKEVEKIVAGEVVTVVETVIVEREVVVTAVPVRPEQAAPTAAAPTPTPGAVVAPVTVQGNLRVSGKTEPPIFRVYLSGRGWADALLTRTGVFEGLIRAEHSPPPNFGLLGGQGIATDWEVSPDQSTITFSIREGVPFHNNWGELTAEDVAFSFNDAISEGSIFTRASPFGEWMDRWEAIDDRTVVLHTKEWNAQWALKLSNQGDTTAPIVSKKAFDQLGSDEFNVTDMGTGPFTVRVWETGNTIILDRFADYFREDGRAQVESITYITMPEQSTQVAAMEAGELDIATGMSGGMDPALVRPLADRIGGTIVNLGPPGGATVNVAGNYWSTTMRETGDEWNPPGFKPDKDHPWIGDPDGPGCDREAMFSQVPPAGPVCDSMENARKVRWAMAMAIDRPLLVETMMDGLGMPSYTEVGVLPDSEHWHENWFIPYDLDLAKQYLADAGYPDGFAVDLWDGVDLTKYMAEPIAQMWEDIGLKVKIDGTAYDAYRPRLVDRSMDFPYIHGGGMGLIDEPKMGSMRPMLGVSRSVDPPDNIVDYHYLNRSEADRAVRIENNAKIEDFLSYWMLVIPTVYDLGRLYVVAPTVEWDPHQAQFGFFSSPERIRFK